MGRVVAGATINWKDEIEKIYYSVKEPGSFFGPNKLYKVLKKRDKSCTLKQVIEWIRNQSVYNIHRARKLKFERRKLVRLRPYETLSADVVFLQDLSKFNSNYSYILTVRCLFSNKAWCYPLKQKSKREVSEALDQLFYDLKGQVVNLTTDNGIEFDLPELYEKHCINRYYVKSPLHACHIENFHRVLENRIYRALTANSTLRWIIYLDDIVDSYNNTPSRRLYNLSPNDCLIPANTEFLKKKFDTERKLMDRKYKKVKNDLEVGTVVHVVKPKTVFSRGYKASFFDKRRKITKILPTSPPTFKVSGLERSYYRAELAPTKESEVERQKTYYIYKERKTGGRQLRSHSKSGETKEFLIKSYSDPEFEEWVDEIRLERLQNEKLLSNFDQWFESGTVQ